MNSSAFNSLLLENFPFDPTLKQGVVLEQLSNFIFDQSPTSLYVLKGFAGTGKTTIIGTIVSNLWKAKKSAVLMAPTGRAAKVIANYAKKEAFTIHKKIYTVRYSKSGKVSFVLAPNKHKKTIFIVDEASMISDIPSQGSLFGSGSVLDDLMQYVYAGHQCKLLLIGDTAQLPPVKLDLSPALDVNKLALNYAKEVQQMELDEVVRQEQDSGILFNATLLREALAHNAYDGFQFDLKGFKDIVRLIDGHEISEALQGMTCSAFQTHYWHL